MTSLPPPSSLGLFNLHVWPHLYWTLNFTLRENFTLRALSKSLWMLSKVRGKRPFPLILWLGYKCCEVPHEISGFHPCFMHRAWRSHHKMSKSSKFNVLCCLQVHSWGLFCRTSWRRHSVNPWEYCCHNMAAGGEIHPIHPESHFHCRLTPGPPHESIKQLLGRWRKTLTERNKGHLSSWLSRVRHKSSHYSFIPRSPPPCLFPNSNSLASILRSHSFWVPRYPKILTIASSLFRVSSQWSLS